MKETIEILAPAKDVQSAKEAIKCGADAIYIACEGFSLRTGLNNSVEDIKELVEYAHKYWVKIYVTVNSLVFTEDDFEKIKNLINKLYEIQVDGIIIQDMGILELDLPPIPIIASTNTNCFTPEKAKFFEEIGISMVVLPRELKLDEIKKISESSNIKLEAFCFGLLCVGYSGKCYLQFAKNILTSKFNDDLVKYQYNGADNGKCDQNCFKHYNLKDADGNYIVKNERLLNLRFNNQINNLEKLLDAGVTSFKIEGRHKEIPYIKNVVASFRMEADKIIQKRNLKKASSGKCYFGFTPDLSKVFNKGYTDYFTTGRKKEMYSKNTLIGEYVGVAKDYADGSFLLDSNTLISCGDKLRYKSDNGEIISLTVKSPEGNRLFADNIEEEIAGKSLYRHFDAKANQDIENAKSYRLIDANIEINESEGTYNITIKDEDDNFVSIDVKKEATKITTEAFIEELNQEPDSEFNFILAKTPEELHIEAKDVSKMIYAKLKAERAKNRPVVIRNIQKNNKKYPEELDYQDNIVNENAINFYKRHEKEDIPLGLETNLCLENMKILKGKYCIKYELGYCSKDKSEKQLPKEPWILEDEDGIEYIVNCDCSACEMSLVVPKNNV